MLRWTSSVAVARACRVPSSLFLSRNLVTRPTAAAGPPLSLAFGPTEPPLLTETIPDHFASVVARHGDRPAVIARSPGRPDSDAFADRVLTYSDLDALSNRLAHSLRALGVRRGDHIAVSLGNTADAAALSYACFKLGAVLAPLNPALAPAQVEDALAQLGASVLIVSAVADLAYKPGRGRPNSVLLKRLVPDLESGGGSGGGGGGGVGTVRSPSLPHLRTVVVFDNRDQHCPDITAAIPLDRYRALLPFQTLLEGAPDPVTADPGAPLSPRDVINVQFTSGTTSRPKAAMLTHTGILNNGALIAGRMGLEPEDRIVVPPPLFHCFGSVLGYMATATTGATILFPSPAFDPAAAVRMVADWDATGLYGVNTMLVAYLEALDSAGSSRRPGNLRKGIVAGSSMAESLLARVRSRLGLEDLAICYGMTETSPVSCMTSPLDDPADRRWSTVGRAMPHTAVKIVDRRDRSRIVAVGCRGELASSGYLVMAGYLGDEARTRECTETDPDGRVWMFSGDEAVMDSRGYVAITGRIKDLIIRAGENISPLEVEDCLFRHPAVAEASVVGVPDERYDEAVAAFLVRRKNGPEGASGDQDDVRAWMRERLAGHFVPRHVFWVDELPKTASGKVQKYKLREMAMGLVKNGVGRA